jgi:hypothetical protein
MQQINNWFKRFIGWLTKPRGKRVIVRELSQQEWESIKDDPAISKISVDDLFELELQQSLAAYQTKRGRLIADHKAELADMERQFHKERASKIKDYKKQQADRERGTPHTTGGG